MTREAILTRRLSLLAMTPEMLEADATSREALAKQIGAQVPSAWPPEHWEAHVFDFLKRQYAETPHTIPWNRYVVLRGETPVLIGNMNGFPKGAFEAEVGYSLLKPWHGLGLATEGMLAFIGQLFADGVLNRITAQTFPGLAASIRVLEKCHFVPDGMGDEEGTVRYRLDRSVFAQAE